MIEQKLLITAPNLKDRLLGGKSSPGKMLVPIFQELNRQVAALIGKEYAKGTLDRYETSLKHTQAFLRLKFNSSDIDIRAIDHEFIMAYDFYLRSERSCNNNSTVKYQKNFKKIILIYIANGWLDKDPFVKYKPKVKEVKRDFLNAEELEVMAKKQLVSDRVSQVRDIFLFSCYTGLAYADVKKLKRTKIVTGIDGQKWVYTCRQKTDTSSRIPLLPQAMELMAKYEEHPQCVNDGLLLPVLSNQKMNSYLLNTTETAATLNIILKSLIGTLTTLFLMKTTVLLSTTSFRRCRIWKMNTIHGRNQNFINSLQAVIIVIKIAQQQPDIL